MKTIKCLFLIVLTSFNYLHAETTQVDVIPFEGTNVNYVSNKAPLVRSRLIKLPTGSIKPQGWLLTQFNLQKEGLCGKLGEISAWLQKEDNAWLKQGGKWGWEEVPYWLRGYSSLAFTFNDKEMLKESMIWIEAILASQREDGNFGPIVNRKFGQDLWPNMVALWILQNYYEFTEDKRVIDFMTRYFKFELSVAEEKFLKDYWENSRGGDNLWSVAWLYNRTGDSFLLELAEKIHRNTADWTKPQRLPNWHNVNVAECFKEPAIYYLFNGKKEMLRATYNVQRLIRKAFGQVPGGMFGADENARQGCFDPRQGTETCGFAEQMASDEILMLISGDAAWADNLEDVAFNSLPAAFMPDYKSLRYLTCPNHTISDSENHSPGIQNNGPFLSMNPFSSRCCQHNHGFAWPYYNDFLIMATSDNGLAALTYSACEVKAKVGEGKEILIKETSDYPFSDRIIFEIAQGKKVEFPLYLRIPRWTRDAELAINGEKVSSKIIEGKFLCIKREWKKGDKVELHFPMHISKRQWQVNNNSVSVDYGPLTLSLLIEEDYLKVDSRKSAIGDSKWQEGADASKWPTWEIRPKSPWNYALCCQEPITLETTRQVKDGINPFTLTDVPYIFKAKGRLVPEWQTDQYGLCGVLPYEDAEQSKETYDIKLVPMGAARLRISAFPQAR